MGDLDRHLINSCLRFTSLIVADIRLEIATWEENTCGNVLFKLETERGNHVTARFQFLSWTQKLTTGTGLSGEYRS